MTSPLGGQSALRPLGNRGTRSMLFTLSLTSLIDAFSILVIYLLMNFSAQGEIINVSKDMQLPKATQSTDLKAGLVVRISENQYFVADKQVSSSQLVKALLENKPKAKEEAGNLIIQADRRLDYAQISPVLQAGSHAGYQNYKFVVLQEVTHQ
jgi:biopolymer transport protein ExbD